MIGKMHLDKTKQVQSIDENELESFNRYLQKDLPQQHLPQNLTTSLSYSKIKINMPVITEQQNETPGHTRQSTVQVSKRESQPQSTKPEQIKLHLRIVFKFYASFGNRQNTRFLKSNKFIKLLCDAQIIPQMISNRDADMLYSQETKNLESLTLEQFQNLLPKLGVTLYPDMSVQQSLIKLYSTHLESLAVKIMQFTDFGQQIQFVLQPIDESFNDYIKPIEMQLQHLHQFVFEDQSTKVSKVQWQFIQFLVQCELIPNYINQSQAQLIFDNIQIREPVLHLDENPNYLFGLNCFVESLILISKTINDLDEFTQFRIILDKIEQSEGFNKFLKKLNRTQSDKVRLFYNIEKSRLSNNTMNKSTIENVQNQNQIKNLKSENKKSENSASRLQSSVMKSSTYFFDTPHMQGVKKLFEHYSQMGEPTNIQSLRNSKFNKLLMHANILNQYISITEADMIYAKLTGHQFVKEQLNNNQLCNGRMTFNQFQMAIKLIADKINQSIDNLIQQNLIPLEKQITQEGKDNILQILVELLQDDEIIQLYENIQPIFNLYFIEYSKQCNDIMFLSEFLKFSMDFDLANILISQTHLTQVFYAVASLNQNPQEQYQDLVYIDKSQFVEAVSIIAILVYQSIKKPIQRIAYLLERIFQAQSGSKIYIKQNKLQNKFQCLLDEIKSKYLQPSATKQKYDFNELINF